MFKRKLLVCFIILFQLVGLLTVHATTNAIPDVNLVQGKQIYSSSFENSNLTADKAIDGSLSTRWSSSFSDNQWLMIDLGTLHDINRVVLNWEAAYALSYYIQISNDGNNWSDVYVTDNGDGKKDDIILSTVSTRYVRVLFTMRATRYGFSLWEIEIYGQESSNMSDSSIASIEESAFTYLPEPTPMPTPVSTPIPIPTPKPTPKPTPTYILLPTPTPPPQSLILAPTSQLNIIPGKQATASSEENEKFTAEKIIDNDLATRWSSSHKDNQWIIIDLGTLCSINRIVLNWEKAYAKAYSVQVSSDNDTWIDVFSTNNGDGNTDDISFNTVNARYVRIFSTIRATKYGVSLWEVNIYGYQGSDNLVSDLSYMAPSDNKKAIPTPTPTPTPSLVGNKSLDDKSVVKVHFINVGFGDSILIQTPDNKTMLIDSGKADATKTVIKYLKDLNITKIDKLVYTHNHDDHIGDSKLLMDSFSITDLVLPNVNGYKGRFYTTVTKALSMGINIIPLKAGDNFSFGEGMNWNVLGPVNTNPSLINDMSLVLKMKYGDRTFLFAADAEKEEENDMINSRYDLCADVLKVGHHGMTTSTTDKFLSLVNPKYAVISSQLKTTDNHVWIDATVKKLINTNVNIMATSDNGNIVISTDGKEIFIEKQR